MIFPKDKELKCYLDRKKQNAYSYFLEVLFCHNELLRRVLKAGNKMLK